MKKSQYTMEQIIGILREAQGGNRVGETARRHNASANTIYQWRHKYGGMEVAEARRMKALEEENARLKRVQRARRVAGLQVRRKRRRTRRLGLSQVERQHAGHRNHVWSWDFIEDQTERGQRFRMPTLLDEYTRESLVIHVAWSIRAVDVIEVIKRAMAEHGVPEHIRSDNGSEFIAYALQDWLGQNAVKTIYIRPGSPWENAYIESFHDKLRDECLNRELFGNLVEARVVIEQWRMQYNQQRPHSSLGYQTPWEFARQSVLGLRSATPPFAPKPIQQKPTAVLTL